LCLSQALKQRIHRPALLPKVIGKDAVPGFFTNGMNLGWSGFTPVGYPKLIPNLVAEHVEKNKLQGKMSFNVYIGASIGQEVEDRWATNGMIHKRWPY